MDEDLKYTFKLSDGVDYKSRYLNYEEAEHKLSVYLEMAGKGYDWGAVDTAFNQWTEPKGKPISEAKREEILARLIEWSKKEKIRIHIGPPIDKEKMLNDYEKKGWGVEHFPDGSTKVSPPKRKNILQRFIGLFKEFREHVPN